MDLADVDELQDGLWDTAGIGESVTVRTAGHEAWTGKAIRTTPDNVDAPPGGLARASGVRGFAFPRSRPVLLTGVTTIEDAGGYTYRVDEIEDAGGERTVVVVTELP